VPCSGFDNPLVYHSTDVERMGQRREFESRLSHIVFGLCVGQKEKDDLKGEKGVMSV